MSGDATEFRGEDESAGEAPPALDLAAALFLFVLGLFFAGMSLSLPIPGKVLSAPGLLPFLTSASLAVMACLLGLSAWRRLGAGPRVYLFATAEAAQRRLAVIMVGIYLLALEVLSFEGFIEIGGRQVPFGGFEPATIVLLSALLRVFWTARLALILAVAIGWTLCLSLAFRGLFGIPLPG